MRIVISEIYKMTSLIIRIHFCRCLLLHLHHMNDTNQISYVDDYMPPANQAQSSAPASSAQAPQNTQSQVNSQSLEDQNIFHLLGVQDATDEEKEKFLDELQQVIWEDFVENDVELLLTEEELVEFKKIGDNKDLSEEDRQNKMVEFLERLIPDLEQIMLEKALELKEEMMRERVTELVTVYQQKPDLLQKVQHAQTLIDSQQWRTAADELNAIRE